MSSTLLNPENIVAAFGELADAKGWRAYHTPKNLAAAVSVEAAELLALFQWLTDEQSLALKNDQTQKQAVAHEMADVLMYLMALADKMDISLAEAVASKIALNKAR